MHRENILANINIKSNSVIIREKWSKSGQASQVDTPEITGNKFTLNTNVFKQSSITDI